jgi:predicted glycosyltransferase
MSFELSPLKTGETSTTGAPCVLTHPGTETDLEDKEGNKATLILAGEDSDQYQQVLRTQRRRRLDQALKGRKAGVTPEQLEAEALDLLVACTLSWKHIAIDGSETFSPTTARKLYEEYPWIREQAERFIGDRANFLPASKTT